MALVDPTFPLAPSLLDRLLDDDPRTTSPFFTLTDLLNPAGLALKLRQAEDPVSAYVREQLPPDMKKGVDEFDVKSPVISVLQEGMVAGLNKLIDGDCLYNPERFEEINLAETTIRMLQENPQRRSLMFLNRWLLEDAYPQLLRTRRIQEAPYSLRELKKSVSRDIESLLNTRRELFEELPPAYKELNRSLLCYGLPDFTAVNLMNPKERKRIQRILEQTVSTFEPRMKTVTVTVLQPTGLDQALHFRIEALLLVDPHPESVAFDAVLQSSPAKYNVQSE